MREEIADLVYPVFHEGLHLRERLDLGETPDLGEAQTRLNQLLRREAEARQWPAYGGDGEFLGIRYALACWLDEIFCDHPPDWARQWSNSKRETALYNTNDRGWKFWQQAGLAEARSERDALEAFYLCVMLGFRGDLAERPAKLLDWRESVERQLGQGQEKNWPGPPELPAPPPNVPPLRAWEGLRRVIAAAVVAVGISLIALVFKVVSDLSRG
jgi:type VI secretion system protein ImpK